METKLKRFSEWLFKLANKYDCDSEEYKLIEKIGEEFEKRFEKFYDVWIEGIK